MNPSQLAINSVSTRQDSLPDLLDAYAAAGFENVEFQLGAVHEYLDAGHDVDDVRSLLVERDLRCVGGFESTVSCFGGDPVEDNREIIENARILSDLGAETMVVGTDGPDTGDEHGEDPDVVDACSEAFAAVARRVDLTLCLEFNWSPVVRSLRSATLVSRGSRRENVGVLFDPAHYHCTPTKFEDLTETTVAEIAHVHVDDMVDRPGDLSHPNDDRALPGEGHLDLDRLLGRVESAGYDGYFSIELFDDDLRAIPPEDAARRMYESLEGLCEG